MTRSKETPLIGETHGSAEPAEKKKILGGEKGGSKGGGGVVAYIRRCGSFEKS